MDPRRTRKNTKKCTLGRVVVIIMAPAVVVGGGDNQQAITNQIHLSPSQDKYSRLKFGGEVLPGQTFEKKIGRDLIFRLIPWEDGWLISVGSKATADHDLARVVTPPYRGINDLQIAGWHFRNADNSGPNEPGPKNVNAPQKEDRRMLLCTQRRRLSKGI